MLTLNRPKSSTLVAYYALWTKLTRTEIKFAYSQIPVENTDLFFQIMRKGVQSSNLRREEEERGERRSMFVTALVPAGDLDCCYTVTVGRQTMMDGLRRLQLTRLEL